MTKVEELRDDIVSVIAMANVGWEGRRDATRDLDVLISVVRVEEAERIRVKLETCWKDIASAYPKEADNGKRG